MESNKEPDLSLLCKYCFETLENAFTDQKDAKFPEEFKGQSYPLFVTWTTGEKQKLRGCIGTFKNDKLEKNLLQYALISAFKDDRFGKIKSTELPNLNCEVSLLIKFEEIKDPMDWVIGTHGIQINFNDASGKNYRGTYLPEVAQDAGWDKTNTLKHLIRKAGFRGTLESVLENMKVTRYQSLKKTISYDEYQKMK